MESTTKNEPWFRHCEDLLKQSDEDRWLTVQFAPQGERARLLALFALNHEIERIPRAVSEAPLGEIRLQWWREAIDEIVNGERPRAHPVVQALALSESCDAAAVAAMSRFLDARARLLYAEPFGSACEFFGWCLETDGALAIAASRAGNEGDVSRAGAAYAAARFGPALAPAIDAETKSHAEKTLAEAAGGLARLTAESSAAIAYVSLARRYLAPRAPSAMAKRLTLFRATLTGRLV